MINHCTCTKEIVSFEIFKYIDNSFTLLAAIATTSSPHQPENSSSYIPLPISTPTFDEGQNLDLDLDLEVDLQTTSANETESSPNQQLPAIIAGSLTGIYNILIHLSFFEP